MRRHLWRLIWIYNVCKCPYCGTKGINGFKLLSALAKSASPDQIIQTGSVFFILLNCQRITFIQINLSMPKQCRSRSDSNIYSPSLPNNTIFSVNFYRDFNINRLSRRYCGSVKPQAYLCAQRRLRPQSDRTLHCSPKNAFDLWLPCKKLKSGYAAMQADLSFFFIWILRPFKNISLISSRSFIKGGRKPENPGKNHLTIRKQNLASHVWPERGSNHSGGKPNGLSPCDLVGNAEPELFSLLLLLLNF